MKNESHDGKCPYLKNMMNGNHLSTVNSLVVGGNGEVTTRKAMEVGTTKSRVGAMEAITKNVWIFSLSIHYKTI